MGCHCSLPARASAGLRFAPSDSNHEDDINKPSENAPSIHSQYPVEPRNFDGANDNEPSIELQPSGAFESVEGINGDTSVQISQRGDNQNTSIETPQHEPCKDSPARDPNDGSNDRGIALLLPDVSDQSEVVHDVERNTREHTCIAYGAVRRSLCLVTPPTTQRRAGPRTGHNANEVTINREDILRKMSRSPIFNEHSSNLGRSHAEGNVITSIVDQHALPVASPPGPNNEQEQQEMASNNVEMQRAERNERIVI
ncbi:Hypothetical protein R9X50_00061000 [Acrodontium crateriforme]|uniref:Uncharacterized protein n=1 Tax=Acrodontium crateriforme TaxID=150365 RepID=A0AAQ3LZ40_9PEZI|nr:Hypothetical protein R9X50_00061000 [Acrodontium crateriforme]